MSFSIMYQILIWSPSFYTCLWTMYYEYRRYTDKYYTNLPSKYYYGKHSELFRDPEISEPLINNIV